jgi:hypothetical protein
MDAGLAIGSLVAPALVLGAGVTGSLVVAGLFLPLLVLAALRPLRGVDRRAVVPRDVLALLRGIPFLALLEPGLLDRLARESRRLTVPAGTAVVTEGEPGDRFYVVAEGTVEVLMGGEPVRRLGGGAWFGELALLHDVPRTATVVAVDDLVLWAVRREEFLGVVAGVGPAVDVAEEYATSRYRQAR